MCDQAIVPDFVEDPVNPIPVTDAIRAELAGMPCDERIIVMLQFQEAFEYCESMAAWHRFLATWVSFGRELNQ